MRDAAAVIRVMSGWARRQVTVEVRLQSGQRIASLWGQLETAGEYQFGSEAEGDLHYRVGDGEFSIDPRIVTQVVEPRGGSRTLVVRLHNDVELTITGPGPPV
jgi:hypothetical protein